MGRELSSFPVEGENANPSRPDNGISRSQNKCSKHLELQLMHFSPHTTL